MSLKVLRGASAYTMAIRPAAYFRISPLSSTILSLMLSSYVLLFFPPYSPLNNKSVRYGEEKETTERKEKRTKQQKAEGIISTLH